MAHKIEDVFDAVLCGQVKFDRSSVDVIFKGLDSVKEAIGGTEVVDVPVVLVNELVDALIAVAKSKTGSENPSDARRCERAQIQGRSAPGETETTGRQRRGFVRVEAEKIDTLLNLAGEMVIARSVLSQLGPELELAFPRNEMVERFSGVSVQMGKLLAELQKSVLKMRMVAIDHVFRRFARPMREWRLNVGKQVHLQVSGGETELDRALVDIVYEPLLHLLRNAVDHGLETGGSARAGKPEAGRIAIRAYHKGNQVVVEVSDDGRGIDPTAVKLKAVEAGAITRQDAEG